MRALIRVADYALASFREGALFEYERLEVFELSQQLVERCARVADRLPAAWRHVADQLRRACTSVAFNIAEGAGEFSRGEKQRFYRMARRSLEESSAILTTCMRIGARSKDAEEAQTIARQLHRPLCGLGGSPNIGRVAGSPSRNPPGAAEGRRRPAEGAP